MRALLLPKTDDTKPTCASLLKSASNKGDNGNWPWINVGNKIFSPLGPSVKKNPRIHDLFHPGRNGIYSVDGNSTALG